MERNIALIGFGEAGMAFAPGLLGRLSGYDRGTDDPATRGAKLRDFESLGVTACDTPTMALQQAAAVLSLVTADQALAAARDAEGLAEGTLWLDMNSVAPATKLAAAGIIDARGGRYVDVAVMAPVLPKRTAVPLLVSGAHAGDAAALLTAAGFTNVSVIAGDIGAASAIKMIRSVMVKGIEALSAECLLAADAAGVRDQVIASLDASWPGGGWSERFNYNLDRMMLHGQRRAAEMIEVVATLDTLGTGSVMSRATIERQRAIGGLQATPPDDLGAKLAVLAAHKTDLAA